MGFRFKASLTSNIFATVALIVFDIDNNRPNAMPDRTNLRSITTPALRANKAVDDTGPFTVDFLQKSCLETLTF